jgi:hypothetical protein
MDEQKGQRRHPEQDEERLNRAPDDVPGHGAMSNEQ